MSVCRIGIAVGRREAACACVRAPSVAPDAVARVPRGAAEPVAASIRKLADGLDPAWRRGEVRVALSPGLLACTDLCAVPFRSEGALRAVAGALAEGRCAGEHAETLAVDALPAGRAGDVARAEVLAGTHETLDAVRAAVREAFPLARLTLVTALPAALLRGIDGPPGAVGLTAGGEAFLFVRHEEADTEVRAFPCDTHETAGLARLADAARQAGVAAQATRLYGAGAEVPTRWGARVPAGLLGAYAAAQLDPADCPNLLNGARDAARGLPGRLRGPLLALGAAAAALLFATGAYFHLRLQRAEAALARAARHEEQLWTHYLPGQRYKPGELVARFKQTLAEQQRANEARRAPSALGFWAELAAALPNPDALGLTLENLQLGPDGGRLTAKVDAKQGEPLAHAAQLEHTLNAREQLAARGDFEARDNQIVVRMRLEYRPLLVPAVQARAEEAKP